MLFFEIGVFMKKRFFTILLGVLLLFTASGCSCAGDTSLIATDNWQKNAPVGFIETCTYTAEYLSAYSDGEISYIKSTNINDDVVTIDSSSYSNGIYTIRTEVISKNSFNTAESDILDNLTSPGIIKVSIDFSIDVNFTLNGTTPYSHTDTQTAVVYLCDNNNSYAPIYSKMESVSTTLTIKDGVASTNLSEVKAEYVYNVKNYTSKIISSFAGEEVVNLEKTYSYSFKSASDNSSLLFLLRNIDLKENSSTTASVPSFAYKGEDKKVGAKNLGTRNLEISFNNQKTLVESNCYQIGFTGAKAGSSKLAYFQNAEGKLEDQTTVLTDKSHLIRFIEILPVYGSYAYQGALVFNLSNVVTKFPA